jgi:hypothetical protein
MRAQGLMATDYQAEGTLLREVRDDRINPFARDVLHRKNVIVNVILRSDSHRLTRKQVLANQVVVRSARL